MGRKKTSLRLWAVAFWLVVWQLAAMALRAAYPHGELLLVWSMGYEPRAGDIVIASKTTAEPLEGEAVVKRAVALAGQTVELDYGEGRVLVDWRSPTFWSPWPCPKSRSRPPCPKRRTRPPSPLRPSPRR